MSTLIPTQPTTLDTRSIPAFVRPGLVMNEGPVDMRVVRRDLDGLTWTLRAAYADRMADVPAASWSAPAEQEHWLRVKHNAARHVWRARLGGHSYYLKYYARDRWDAAFKRVLGRTACRAEWESGIFALRAGIAAARPVGFVERLVVGGRLCSLLVSEAIEPAEPLSEFWRDLGAASPARDTRRERDELIERLAEMIARAHQAGFEHRDMHAANILVGRTPRGRLQTWFVDLHSARLGAKVRDSAVVRNLAQLNQWFRRHSSISERVRFLRAYLRWRNEYEHALDFARPLDSSFRELVHALVRAADEHAERLWRQRDRRVGRCGRYFTRVRPGGGWRGMAFVRSKRPADVSRASSIVLERAWWEDALAGLLKSANTADADCKHSHSAWVGRAELQTPDGVLGVIIKRPLGRNWRRRLRQMFPPSRSARGWRVGNALLHRNLIAARPLAMLEQRFGPLVRRSLLITELAPGALDLAAHLRAEYAERTDRSWRRHKRVLCDLLVRQIRSLQDRRFIHRDCKAENLLVCTRPRLRLAWIDMDGLRTARRALTLRERLEPLLRLHVSLLDVPGLTRSDRARFLKSYCARFGADARLWRSAWRQIVAGVDAKLAARQARRRWKVNRYGRA